MPVRVRLLANPASGRGRGARVIPDARAALSAAGLGNDVVTTNAPGDEVRLAHEAVADGIETLVVLGGDGTWSQAARGVIEAGGGHRCRLAFLAAGTGNDLVKSIGAPASDLAETARLVAQGHEKRIDAGRVAGHLFFNCAGFGFDAAVLERTQRPTRFRGAAVYIAAALSELFGYAGLLVRVDGAPEANRLMLVVSNGEWFGGTFHIAPGAHADDGLLDMVSITDAGTFARLGLFARVVRGTHLSQPSVEHRRATNFHLQFTQPPAVQIDGELVQLSTADVRIECLPDALAIVSRQTSAFVA